MIAVEPSDVMAAQRPPTIPPALRASAADLPLRDDSVDAAMAVLTVHHWDGELERGLEEMRRVARDAVVILTYDPLVSGEMWLMADYLPEVAELDRRSFPSPQQLVGRLGGRTRIEVVPVSRDTPDWMLGSFWAHPERVLDEQARNATSGSHAWMPRWFNASSETCVAISKAVSGTNGTATFGSSTRSTRASPCRQRTVAQERLGSALFQRRRNPHQAALLHRDDLEADPDVIGLRIPREPHLGGAAHTAALLRVDSPHRPAEARASPLLHLDEREPGAAADDQVELVAAGLHVCADDPVAAQPVMPERPPLARVHDFVFTVPGSRRGGHGFELRIASRSTWRRTTAGAARTARAHAPRPSARG